MPVKVKCTSCEKVLSVPDAARGKAIKCPACQARIAVPAESASRPSPAAKPKAKKPAKPADSEFALVTLDMRKAVDTSARICPKCGYDMKYQDEEDTECPQCGFDVEAGGLGAKATKKAMKGPDPADFYPGLVKDSWKFVVRNISLAGRTIAYSVVSLTIALACAFFYLWLSMWPTRIFLALCFTVSILTIPGWMWVLNTEVIKLTMERKDKFKKLNFDFFLSSAMGFACVAWICAVVVPLIGIPAAVGYLFVKYMGGRPEVVLPICLGIGLLPSIWMIPVAMAHFVMPIAYKGWLVWKLVPLWARNIKPLSVWLMWFIITNIPAIGGVTAIAVIYGQDLVNITQTMETNADIARQVFNAQENPNAKRKGKKGAAPAAPVVIGKPSDVDFKPLIVPVAILYAMCVANGFTCMFNMRNNGRFAYYFKNHLDLVDKKKEYKYVAKKVVDEDEDEKPKTIPKLLVDGIVFYLIFDLIGLVGGMLYGSFTDVGPGAGIFLGIFYGQSLGYAANFAACVKYSFRHSVMWGAITFFGLFPIGFIVFVFQDWEERKGLFIQTVIGFFLDLTLLVVGLASGLLFSSGEMAFDAQPNVPAIEQPVETDADAAKAQADKAPAAEPVKPVAPAQ